MLQGPEQLARLMLQNTLTKAPLRLGPGPGGYLVNRTHCSSLEETLQSTWLSHGGGDKDCGEED